MARTSRRETSRREACRLGTVLGGLVATAALAGCAALFASGAFASSGSEADRIVVCESGTVTVGEIETSSAVAARVPAGEPLSPGCREV